MSLQQQIVYYQGETSIVGITVNNAPGTSTVEGIAVTAVDQYSTSHYAIKPVTSFDLYMGIIAVGDLIGLYNADGSLIATIGSGLQLVGQLVAGKEYLIKYFKGSGGTANAKTIMFQIEAYINSNVSDYFTEGYVPVALPLVTTVVDPNSGAVTYTFTDFPVSSSLQLNIGTAEIATQPGNLIVSSSNNSIFPSYSQTFVAYNSILVVLDGLQDTTFTGTVVVTVGSAGNLVQNELFPILRSFMPESIQTFRTTEPELQLRAAPVVKMIGSANSTNMMETDSQPKTKVARIF